MPRRILGIVHVHPGETVAQVAARLAMPIESARYHAHKLIHAGSIVPERVGNKLHLFPASDGFASSRERLRRVLASDGGATFLLDLLGLGPPCTRRELSLRAGVSVTSVRFQLEKLVRAGLVGPVPDTHPVRFEVIGRE